MAATDPVYRKLLETRKRLRDARPVLGRIAERFANTELEGIKFPQWRHMIARQLNEVAQRHRLDLVCPACGLRIETGGVPPIDAAAELVHCRAMLREARALLKELGCYVDLDQDTFLYVAIASELAGKHDTQAICSACRKGFWVVER